MTPTLEKIGTPGNCIGLGTCIRLGTGLVDEGPAGLEELTELDCASDVDASTEPKSAVTMGKADESARVSPPVSPLGPD